MNIIESLTAVTSTISTSNQSNKSLVKLKSKLYRLKMF